MIIPLLHLRGDIVTPIFTSVIIFLVVLAIICTVGATLITKMIPRQERVALRIITQPTLTVTGMMFSVLLGFFIAQSLKEYTAVNQSLVNEANALGEVFRDARGLAEKDRKRIRGLCRDYADSVIVDEWPLIMEGRESPKSQQIMNELWEASLSVQPKTVREQVIYASYFHAMNDLGGFRRVRTSSLSFGLAAHFWAIIATGAASIVLLTFLFAPDSKSFHVGLLMCLLIPLTLNILLLAEYSYPFHGSLTVKPRMFEILKTKILSQDDSDPHFLLEDNAQSLAPQGK